MTSITVNARNIDAVKVGLRNVGRRLPDVWKAEVKAAMEWAKWYASGGYPNGSYSGYNVAILPNQRYRRTGTYGLSFRVVDNGYRSFSLVSNAQQRGGQVYTPYVGGYADGSGQARIHAGRWPLIRDAINAAVEPLLERAEQSLRTLFANEGIGL